jgi:hypothetical protein
MSMKAGYPYVAAAVRRLLNVDTSSMPKAMYTAIDPDTCPEWYEDHFQWFDTEVEKPAKADLEVIIAELKAERQASGIVDESYDVII